MNSWEGIDLTRLGKLDQDTVYRVRFPERADSWLALVPSETAADRRLAELAQDRRPATGLANDIAKAARIADHLENGRPVVFAGPAGLDRWLLCLLFLVDTTEVYVIEPQRHRGSKAMLGAPLGRRRIGDVDLVEHELYGWKFVVVDQIKSESPIVK